jgi:peroxiredoxin
MERIGDGFTKLRVLDEKGQEVELGSLYKEKPVVLAFLRHFACPACFEHVAELRGAEGELAKKNAEIVLIGNGAPPFIPPFRERTGWKGPVYTDPTRSAYEQAGMHRRVLRFLDPRGLWGAIRAAFKGFFPGPEVKGDSLQLGGVLVLKPPGDVVFRHASRYVGDHPSNEAVVRSLA